MAPQLRESRPRRLPSRPARHTVGSGNATLPCQAGGDVDEDGSLPMLRSFVCPITQETMVDPVATADGHLYERQAIKEWLRRRHTSPVTGERLNSLALTPQPRVRGAIDEYKHQLRTLGKSSRVLEAEGVSTPSGVSQQVERLKEALQLPEEKFRAESIRVIQDLETLLKTPGGPNRVGGPRPIHCRRCGYAGAPTMDQEREQLACLAVLHGHDQHVNSVDSLSEDRVVSGSGDGAVKIWDIPNRQCCSTFTGHAASVSCVTRLGSNHVISCSWDSTIRVWNQSLHQHGSFVLGDCSCKVHSVTVISSSSVMSGSQDGRLRLWDVDRQSQVLTLSGHSEQVLGAQGLSDHIIASCSGDRTVKLWDLRTQRCTATLQGHGGSIRAVTALPGSRLASGSSDSSIKVWDLGSRRHLFSLHGHGESVWSVTAVGVSRLASGSLDGTVRLWELRDNTCHSVLHDHSGGVSKLATAGTNLVSSSLDHTVRIWGSFPSSTH